MTSPHPARLATCFLLLLLSAELSAESAVRPRRVVIDKSVPLTIAVSTVGRFSEGHSWHLSVNSAGEGELVVDTYPQQKRSKVTVSPEKLEALREVLNREDFFGLAPSYGQNVSDASWDTVTVVAGDRSHTVRIGYLMNWVHNDRERLRDPARAVRVYSTIRDWFSVPEAVDLRRYDAMVLDAVATDTPTTATR